MSKQDQETADEVLRGGKKAGEKLLGIDDESLRKVQADRRTAAEKAEGGLAGRMQTFWGFWWLWANAAEAEDDAYDEERRWKRDWIRFVLIAIVGVILVSAAAYLAFGRSSDPTDALKTSGTTAGDGAAAPTTSGAPEADGAPRRWLIVADTPLYGERPQFTIELQGEGQSGQAVWLEPPLATGTYDWNGDNVVVRLVITQTAAPGVTFPQHFEVRMKKKADGSLSGQLLSENWAYSSEGGLQIKGMEPWPAVGEPK